jgi:hypothetical protein
MFPNVLLILLGIHFYIKERNKKQREWQEKRDEETKRTLVSKLHGNSSSDMPDK